MSHFEDEAGNEFIIVKGDDVVPPGVERLEFSSREEVEALLLKLTATPEGRAQLQRLRAEMGAADDLFKPH